MKKLLDDSPKIRLLLAISYGNTESFNKCIREGAKVLDTNFNALTTVIRQIHSRQTVQSPKVESAVEMCKFIMNSYPEIVTTEFGLKVRRIPHVCLGFVAGIVPTGEQG